MTPTARPWTSTSPCPTRRSCRHKPNPRIAIVGVACRYPDTASPRELRENAAAPRRTFRRLPGERTRLDDCWGLDPLTPDWFSLRTAAVTEDYEFDRTSRRSS
ncbi:beta-ketoacyl synthase N-terminal-like domain-containing protein [Actinomadura kijaniata]|uniref:beta-ketoacyl synthase N-terminal-like domain-containing protein n=1 Tax=Actinomadura kijaniata TaxID=46161 RepID=UPI003F1A2A2E